MKAAPKKDAAKKDVLRKDGPRKDGPRKAGAKKVPVKAAKKVTAKKVTAKKEGPAPAPLPGALARKVGPKKLRELAPLLASMVPPAASEAAVLDRLFAVITERRGADPTQSHSARLLARGMAKVAQKFGEEAVECLIEAVAGNKAELVGESADVLYHLLVMWVAAGVTPGEVWAELARREGVSGIAEKAARARPLGTTKIP